MINRILVTSLLAILALTGGLLIRTSVQTRNQATGVVTWPAFVMIFKEEGHIGFVSDGKPGTQTYELVYEGPQHWQLTILDSTKKDNIGSWETYDGKTVTRYQAGMDYTEVTDVAGEQGNYVPNEWLRPTYIESLQTRSATVRPALDQADTETLILIEQMPCSPDIPYTELQQELGVPPCADDQANRAVVREVTYTTDHFITMKILETVDGVPVYTVTVEELTFK